MFKPARDAGETEWRHATLGGYFVGAMNSIINNKRASVVWEAGSFLEKPPVFLLHSVRHVGMLLIEPDSGRFADIACHDQSFEAKGVSDVLPPPSSTQLVQPIRLILLCGIESASR